MRRTTMALVAAAAAVFAAKGDALAAPPIALPEASRHAAEQVQYYQYYQPDWRGPRDFDEHRWQRRQQRRAWEEERIAEAARREAWRIERERAERRAWRHAQRERFGYYRGF